MRKSVFFSFILIVFSIVVMGCKNETPERLRLDNQESEIFDKAGNVRERKYGSVFLNPLLEPNKCSGLRIAGTTQATSDLGNEPVHVLRFEIKDTSIQAQLQLLDETDIQYKVIPKTPLAISIRKFSVDMNQSLSVYVQKRVVNDKSITLRVCVKSEPNDIQLPSMFKCLLGAEIEFDRATKQAVAQSFFVIRNAGDDIFSVPDEKLSIWKTIKCSQ